MMRILIGMIAVALGAGCDDNAPDGIGLTVETLAQPTSPDLGVLLALHARGGDSIYVSVESGTFIAAGAGEGSAGSSAQVGCLSNTTTSDVFTFELAIVPHGEALLLATLYPNNDCTGPVVQSRILAVRVPVAGPTVDAGVEDAP
jgi:hypothetical protein